MVLLLSRPNERRLPGSSVLSTVAACTFPLPRSQVTLVDQSDRFVFKPLLYELINGTATEVG